MKNRVPPESLRKAQRAGKRHEILSGRGGALGLVPRRDRKKHEEHGWVAWLRRKFGIND